MKHLMPNDPRHEISRSTGGHFKRRHKRSPHRSRDVPLPPYLSTVGMLISRYEFHELMNNARKNADIILFWQILD
jgi:hypothetical protein